MRRVLAFGSSLLSTYAYCENKSSEIFEKALKSTFTVFFIDDITEKEKSFCTGFFISNEGLGITSGPFAKAFRGSKVKIKLYNSKEIYGKVLYYEESPAVGFIQVDNSNCEKLEITKTECQEGEDLYVFGIRDNDIYYSEAYATDTRHKWIVYDKNGISKIDAIRVTGVIPNACLGAPLIDLNGNAVGIVFNIEMGIGVAYSLANLKSVFTKEEEPIAVKIWKSLKMLILGA